MRFNKLKKYALITCMALLTITVMSVNSPVSANYQFTFGYEGPSTCTRVPGNDCSVGKGCNATIVAACVAGTQVTLNGACSNIMLTGCKCIYTCTY